MQGSQERDTQMRNRRLASEWVYRLPGAMTGVFGVAMALFAQAQPAAPSVAMTPEVSSPQAVTESSMDSGTVRILFIGDSLAAGYGVKKEEGFPEKAGELLRAKGYDVAIINAGISGSVTAEADRRIRWYLKAKPQILVLELGGNDGLKGTPPKVIKENLARAIDLAQASGIKVVLAGMRVFSNLGAQYTKEFEAVYTELAREKKVALIPFLLEGVALDRSLNQADGKHPNAKGHEIIARTVARELEKHVKDLSAKGVKR